jgi:deoxyadenosine/deoxycytidine kinase
MLVTLIVGQIKRASDRFVRTQDFKIAMTPSIQYQAVRRISHSPLLISIEGNIGAGKSTLIDAVRTGGNNWSIIEEPVGVWETVKNEKNETLLEVFYKDRRRWSYTFQSCALLSRFENVERAVESTMKTEGVNKRIFITERCLDTDFNVFTRMLNDEGSIDKLEFDIYQRLFRHLQAKSVPLRGIIHLETAPSECLRRIRSRGRGGEGGISLEYLQSLDKYQRLWIDSTSLPVLKLRGDGSAEELNSVMAFLSRLEATEER